MLRETHFYAAIFVNCFVISEIMIKVWKIKLHKKKKKKKKKAYIWMLEALVVVLSLISIAALHS